MFPGYPPAWSPVSPAMKTLPAPSATMAKWMSACWPSITCGWFAVSVACAPATPEIWAPASAEAVNDSATVRSNWVTAVTVKVPLFPATVAPETVMIWPTANPSARQSPAVRETTCTLAVVSWAVPNVRPGAGAALSVAADGRRRDHSGAGADERPVALACADRVRCRLEHAHEHCMRLRA